jgi:hypothetical protein
MSLNRLSQFRGQVHSIRSCNTAQSRRRPTASRNASTAGPWQLVWYSGDVLQHWVAFARFLSAVKQDEMLEGTAEINANLPAKTGLVN